LVEPPTLVESIVAVVEPEIGTMLLVVTSSIKASVSVVSNVSSSSLVPLHVLVDLLSVVSGVSPSSIVEACSVENVVSVSNRSDGLSSPVEDEPLVSVIWVVIPQSEVGVEECSDWSLVTHLSSDLELNSISNWISWVSDSLKINLPSLVLSVGASGPLDVIVGGVLASYNIQASDTHVSNVSSASIEPSDSLDHLGLVSSNNGGISIREPVVVVPLNGDSHVSVVISSDRSSSPVEDPPLLRIFWIVVSDSKSVFAVSDVLMVENSSVISHDGFDLESDTISEWVSWEVDSSGISEPSSSSMT